ncbi:MAG: GAF domain-containing protein [Deltaproteobacteria bacterium]|nr:MAG: GAF domain-containing protein [Deltaproteobacteria bacterium]
MRFEVRSVDDERKVRLDAVDWMMAMSKAIEQWRVTVHGWTCSTRKNGDVWVQDPTTGLTWVVSPLSTEAPRRPLRRKDSAGPPPPPPPGVGRSLGAPPPPNVKSVKPKTAAPAAPAPDDAMDAPPAPGRVARKPKAPPQVVEVDRAAPPPRLRMPTEGPQDPSYGPGGEWAPDEDEFDPEASIDAPDEVAPTIAKEMPEEMRIATPGPENLAERLFDMADEIAACPSAYEASELVLELCMREIGCEAGSVLRGSLNDQALTFVACAGPAGDALVGRKLRFGRGLVGFAFDKGFTIIVNDVDNDERHLSAVDDETGFHTMNVLCTPIRSESEHFGVVQLLNAEGGFHGWHAEVAESLTKSLAAALSAGLH